MNINRKFFRLEFTTDNIYKPTDYGSNYDVSCEYDGFIKCKLVHKEGTSVVLPELLIIGNRSFDWIQHFTFLMNLLVKEDDHIVCSIILDLSFGATIRVQFLNTELQIIYKDNSSLFRCKIFGPKNLNEYYTGTGFFDEFQTPYLNLFHHTKDEIKEIIEKTEVLKPSKWNFQGTKELVNINFIYFTCIDRILKPGDLKQIAMSSDGKLLFLKDNYDILERLPENFKEIYKDGVLEVSVYRESTNNRTAAISFYIDSTKLFTPNLWLHKPEGNAIFYEICNPYIYRLGINPKEAIRFIKNTITCDNLPIQDYLVIGDCTQLAGLEAPYDEEQTSEIFKIEPLFEKINILDFWFENGNKDLYSEKTVDVYKFKK